MTLKLVGGNLVGEGVSLSPEPGIQAFEVYRVTAKRLIGRAKAGGDSSEALPGLPGWLCDALTAFLQKVFSRATAGLFAPMEVCDPSMNGRGYYLFGDTGPGAGREYGTVTIYVPWETLSFCPQDSLYAFTIHSKESYTPIDSLLSVLEKASELGDFFSIPLSDLVQKVRSFYDTYGNFAVSLGISTNTGSISVYVNTSSGASEDLCNEIANSSSCAGHSGGSTAYSARRSKLFAVTISRTRLPSEHPLFRFKILSAILPLFLSTCLAQLM